MNMPRTHLPQDQEFFSLAEVGKRLGLSRMTVYRYVQEKRLPAYRFGKHYRIRNDDLEKFISKQKV